MKKYKQIIIFMILMSFIFLISESIYAMGSHPKIERQKDVPVTGMFRVIFFGYDYASDPLTVAILDLEGDQYTFEPLAHKSKYMIKQNLSSENAIKEAEWFVSRNRDHNGFQLKKISVNGKIIGYEISSLYHHFRYGLSDILDVRYWFKDSRVVFTVDYDHRIIKRFNTIEGFH